MMSKILNNTSIFIFTILIFTLSMGVNVSKISCDKGNNLFLGIEVPSCSQVTKITCVMQKEKVFCCIKEVKKSCCTEIISKSCTTTTKNFQFNFETLVTFFKFNFIQDSSLLHLTSLFNSNFYFKSYINYNSSMQQSKLYKPELSKLQSFLL